jgi:hypothetical protein
MERTVQDVAEVAVGLLGGRTQKPAEDKPVEKMPAKPATCWPLKQNRQHRRRRKDYESCCKTAGVIAIKVAARPKASRLSRTWPHLRLVHQVLRRRLRLLLMQSLKMQRAVSLRGR